MRSHSTIFQFRGLTRATVNSILAVLALIGITNQIVAEDSRPGTYQVVDGKVDRHTYLGWKVYHTACFGCHGLDATGTDVAPSLVERVKPLTPREFTIKVLTRYRIAIPSTEASDEEQSAYREAIIEEVMKEERGKHGEIRMPAWETNLKVKPHILDLYAYLSARADEALGPGRPKLISKKGQRDPR